MSSGLGALGQARHSAFADRLRRRCRIPFAPRLGRKHRGRLPRRLREPGKRRERAVEVAALKVREDLRGERLRIVAPRLAEMANLDESAEMGEEPFADTPRLRGGDGGEDFGLDGLE